MSGMKYRFCEHTPRCRSGSGHFSLQVFEEALIEAMTRPLTEEEMNPSTLNCFTFKTRFDHTREIEQ